MLEKASVIFIFVYKKVKKVNKQKIKLYKKQHNLYTNQHNLCYNLFGDFSSSKGSEKRVVSVQALCNTIIKKSFDENVTVSPMKLQKLVYFIYRNYLQETSRPLFAESFQAWKYGPVLESIYDEFKSFKSNRITRFAKTASGDVYVINEISEPELCSVINSVWDKYKNYDGIALSQITHKKGGAWRKAFENYSPILNVQDIKEDNVS